MSTAQVNSSRNELLFCGLAFADVFAPGLGSTVVFATSLFQNLAECVRENEALKASQLMRCLGATWEKICTEQAKEKYLSRESAEQFVSLVEEVIRYEMMCQQRSIPNPFSNEGKRLKVKVDNLQHLKFEHV